MEKPYLIYGEYIKTIIIMERICIYPKDIQLITGKSQRYGRLVIQKIKEKYAKEKKQLVTVEEFCTYSGLKYDYVLNSING